MKPHRLTLALTGANLAILVVTLLRGVPATASEVAPVLRGRGLEIVDQHNKLRAQIVLEPREPRTA